MTNEIILLTLCTLLLAPCSAVQGQQSKKIPRIGIVTGIVTDPNSRIKTFRQALQSSATLRGRIFV
jgi:hypothetical protein